MSATSTRSIEQTVASESVSSSWWPIADLAVLGVWIVVTYFTLLHHEKWADEAQAWLLARDLDLPTLWFKELRYEGCPGLWHTILWVAQHWFHARYADIGLIGLACATAGVAFMLWRAPFPRPLRYLLAFSYFIVYQYAVIARPYTLIPLLAFAAAHFFRDRERPERMTLVLALLSLVTVHGILIAAGLGVAYLLETAKDWRSMSLPLRRRYVVCISFMLLLVLFLFVILKPTPDVEVLASMNDPGQPPKLVQLTSVLSGALMDHVIPSSLFLLLAGVWCYMRRRLITLALPTALLVAFYVMVYGRGQHQGTLFIAVIAGLWIAWPTEQEQKAFIKERRATQAMIALLACLFVVNVWDAAVSIRNDYLYPYSGAEDAANYLKSVGASARGPIFGLWDGVVGVQAYFDHNILSNTQTAYYHHGSLLAHRVVDLGEFAAARPEYIIYYSLFPDRDFRSINAPLNALGYGVVHFSDGILFFKQSGYGHQAYFVYRRTVN